MFPCTCAFLLNCPGNLSWESALLCVSSFSGTHTHTQNYIVVHLLVLDQPRNTSLTNEYHKSRSIGLRFWVRKGCVCVCFIVFKKKVLFDAETFGSRIFLFPSVHFGVAYHTWIGRDLCRDEKITRCACRTFKFSQVINPHTHTQTHTHIIISTHQQILIFRGF